MRGRGCSRDTSWWCTSSPRESSRSSSQLRNLGGHREVFRAPAGESAAQRERLGESLRVELPHGGGGQRSGFVDDHHRLFLVALVVVAGGQDLVRRQLLGAVHMAQRELL